MIEIPIWLFVGLLIPLVIVVSGGVAWLMGKITGGVR